MDKKLVKRNMPYYAIVSQSWMYHPTVVVPVIVCHHKPHDSGHVVVRQTIGGKWRRFTVRYDELVPFTTEAALIECYNREQREKRMNYRDWKFRFGHANAKAVVLAEFFKLPKVRRAKLMAEIRKNRPDLIRADGALATSKMNMQLWAKLQNAITDAKFPLRD
jgi:hypothetical protein